MPDIELMGTFHIKLMGTFHTELMGTFHTELMGTFHQVFEPGLTLLQSELPITTAAR